MPSIRDATVVVKELAGVVKSHVAAALAPLAARVKALEDQRPEKGEKGDTGPQGAPGRDAEPMLAADVVAELLQTDAFKALVDLQVAESVAEHFKANPVRDGKDGERGPQGERGAEGPAGKDGRDGLDVRDMLRNADGHLIAVMSDGTTRDLGEFVGKDGRDGKDGADGLSMVDVARDYIPETHEIIERWTVGGVSKELRYPAGGIRPGGFWTDGKRCPAGMAVTHDGALWIAKRDTAAKPSLEAKEDWQLAVRKGRDGKDGRHGIDKTASVNVNFPGAQ